jgi:hypothetical protein
MKRICIPLVNLNLLPFVTIAFDIYFVFRLRVICWEYSRQALLGGQGRRRGLELGFKKCHIRHMGLRGDAGSKC